MKLLFLLVAAAYLVQLGTSQLGQCPQDQLLEIFTADCIDGFNTVTNTSIHHTTDEFTAAHEKLCGTGECINDDVADQVATSCNDTVTFAIYGSACLSSNDAGVGPSCLFAIAPTQADEFTRIFEALVPCYEFLSSGTCPETCRLGLIEMSEQFDCCYQHYYNNTVYLDTVLREGHITQEYRDFFAVMGTAALWNECNVPIVDTCQEVFQPTMATQGATRAFGTIVTSISAALTAITMIMYTL